MRHDIFINGFIGDIFDMFGDGNSFSLKNLNEELAANPNSTEIIVHINSGGGLVSEGFAIYDKLVSLNKPVTTIVEGMCGSIATVIAQAGSRGKRKMFQNSEYFIHNPLWVPGGPDAHTADELEMLTAELRKNEDRLIDFYVKNTTASREDLSAKMKVETTLTAQEAKAMGFIDEVINTDVRAMVRYKIAAAVSVPAKQNNNIMADLKKEITDGFKAIETMLNGIINRGKKMNDYAVTSEGSKIFYEGNLGEGTAVFTDEAMTTPFADGDVTVDGKQYHVENGVVASVADEQKNELQIANERISALESELTAAKAEKDKAVADVEEIRLQAVKVNEEFVAFKNKITTGEGQSFEAPEVEKNVAQNAKLSWQEQVIANRKKEAKQ